jgi:hypothetical protein
MNGAVVTCNVVGHTWPIVPSQMLAGTSQTCERCGTTVTQHESGRRSYRFKVGV